MTSTTTMTTTAARPSPTTAVRGGPRTLLRLEGAAVLAAACLAYGQLGAGWWTFAALFLVPDLSMLGYLAGPRLGAALYNAGHSYLAPALLAALTFALDAPGFAAALIWVAHIGFDRMAGFGLKYGSRFADTHLGVVGGTAEARPL